MKVPLKFLFLGLDGCTYEGVKKSGCSFLTQMFYKHQHGLLLSDDEHGRGPIHKLALTGPAWNTIYTGFDAKRHLVSAAGWLKGHRVKREPSIPTIFDYFQKKHKVGIMCMPALFPSHDPISGINGWAINGFPAMGKVKNHWCYPETLEIFEDFNIERFPIIKQGKIDLARKEVKAKVNLARSLTLKHKNEVLALGIQHLDYLNHTTTDMAEHYQFIDSIVEKLFSIFSIKNFIMASDHGFTRGKTIHSDYGFYLTSLKGEYRERSIFDIAPLSAWIMEVADYANTI